MTTPNLKESGDSEHRGRNVGSLSAFVANGVNHGAWCKKTLSCALGYEKAVYKTGALDKHLSRSRTTWHHRGCAQVAKCEPCTSTDELCFIFVTILFFGGEGGGRESPVLRMSRLSCTRHHGNAHRGPSTRRGEDSDKPKCSQKTFSAPVGYHISKDQ